MEEVVPGASVCPTRARLGDTQAGIAEVVGATPFPDKVIIVGEFVALLAAMMLPVTLPAAAGAKVTFNVVVCPGCRVVPEDTPLALKPAPEILML
jgi:hypothetical protein